MIAIVIRLDTELRLCSGDGEQDTDKGDISELDTQLEEQISRQGESKVEEGSWQDGEWQDTE